MNVSGNFGDYYVLQVAANLLQRDIVIIPTQSDSTHYIKKYCLIRANVVLDTLPPIYLLWFEETVYGCGHYQSIEPACMENNQILMHYQWLRRSERSRILSSSGFSEIFQPQLNSTEKNTGKTIYFYIILI